MAQLGMEQTSEEDFNYKLDPAFIQHSWILLVFTWTCRVGDDFPLSLHAL